MRLDWEVRGDLYFRRRARRAREFGELSTDGMLAMRQGQPGRMRQMRGVHYAYRYRCHLARFFPLLDLTFC